MPSGEIISDPKIIMEFAHEYDKERGLKLIDKDPVKAYK